MYETKIKKQIPKNKKTTTKQTKNDKLNKNNNNEVFVVNWVDVSQRFNNIDYEIKDPISFLFRVINSTQSHKRNEDKNHSLKNTYNRSLKSYTPILVYGTRFLALYAR